LFTPLSAEAWKLYCQLDGLKRLRTPVEYYKQTALWIECCEVIDAERNRIEKEQSKHEPD